MENVYGKALWDYFKQEDPQTLFLHNNYGSVETMPVEAFFREPEDFPELEQMALAFSDGKILDVGAGVGSHALFLQEKGQNIHALEACETACKIMRERGLKNVINANFFEYNVPEEERYDTLLFIMNGIGIAGNLENLVNLFEHAKKLLKPTGQLIFDSSDIAYLYEDGSVIKPKEYYYGEVGFQYEYKGIKGTRFPWLYVDQYTLGAIGQSDGWAVQIIFEDGNDQYLARMEQRREDFEQINNFK